MDGYHALHLPRVLPDSYLRCTVCKVFGPVLLDARYPCLKPRNTHGARCVSLSFLDFVRYYDSPARVDAGGPDTFDGRIINYRTYNQAGSSKLYSAVDASSTRRRVSSFSLEEASLLLVAPLPGYRLRGRPSMNSIMTSFALVARCHLASRSRSDHPLRHAQ